MAHFNRSWNFSSWMLLQQPSYKYWSHWGSYCIMDYSPSHRSCLSPAPALAQALSPRRPHLLCHSTLLPTTIIKLDHRALQMTSGVSLRLAYEAQIPEAVGPLPLNQRHCCNPFGLRRKVDIPKRASLGPRSRPHHLLISTSPGSRVKVAVDTEILRGEVLN